MMVFVSFAAKNNEKDTLPIHKVYAFGFGYKEQANVHMAQTIN